MLRQFLCAAVLMAFAQGVQAQPAELDPEGLVRPELLAGGVAALHAAGPDAAATGRLVVIDYALPSSAERLYVVDLLAGGVSAYRVAHGRGSDPGHDGFLDHFSDAPGSLASPGGVFRIAETYHGQHGLSRRLDGLEAGNAASRDRAIVIHAADYAEPEHLARHGTLGRSNGCIVFARADLDRFNDEVPEGTLIYAAR
jgi:hypothetical protein